MPSLSRQARTLAYAVAAAALVLACSSRKEIGPKTGAGGAAPPDAGTGTGGATSSGGTAGGDAAAGGGGGGAGGNAGAGGSAGGTGSGGAAGGLQPRVLVVDPATNRFAAYDRNGQVARDYVAQLDFGAGFGNRTIWLGPWMSNWDGSDTGAGTLSDLPRGLAEPLAPSRILVRAAARAGATVMVRVLAVDGAASDLALAGSWDAFQISPARRYLYATLRDDLGSAFTAAVIRASDGGVVWRGAPSNAGFSRDDAHFVFVPDDTSAPIYVVDLATGAVATPPLAEVPFGRQAVPVGVQAALTDRAIVKTYGWDNYGPLLWTVDWLGHLRRFGTEMPRFTDEYFAGVSPTGGKAVWQRQTNGLDGNPVMLAGAFEVDLASNATSVWNGGDFACYGHPDATAFKTSGGSVQACPCAGGACTPIASLPSLESGWIPRLSISADRRVVVLTHDWSLNRLPTTRPDIVCLSATGKVLATIPYGVVDIDHTGQLLVVRQSLGTARSTVIVDLLTGSSHPIGDPPTAQFVYE